MPPRKLTPVQVLEHLLNRLEKRMEALQRVKLGRLSDGNVGVRSGEWTTCAGRSATWKSEGATLQTGASGHFTSSTSGSDQLLSKNGSSEPYQRNIGKKPLSGTVLTQLLSKPLGTVGPK